MIRPSSSAAAKGAGYFFADGAFELSGDKSFKDPTVDFKFWTKCVTTLSDSCRPLVEGCRGNIFYEPLALGFWNFTYPLLVLRVVSVVFDDLKEGLDCESPFWS